MAVSGGARLVIVSLVSVSLIAGGGCQSDSSSNRSAEPSEHRSSLDRMRAEQKQKDNLYFNPSGEDDSDNQAGFFGGIALATAGLLWAIISVPINGLKHLSGERPSQAARMMEDASSADNRREGINKLLEYDFTKRDPYTRRYRQIAQYDSDPIVRATAIRALNRARDAQATPIFIAALNDKNDLIRLEAAKALANVPDVAAADPLLQLLNKADENRDVRIAAADALKHYRTLVVARALAASLADRDFAVAWQSRKSLKYLFSRDFGYDQAAWLAYVAGPDSPVK
jgi:hypothetical protein